MDLMFKEAINDAAQKMRKPESFPTAVYCTKEVWEYEQANHPERFRVDAKRGLLWCGRKVEYIEDIK